MREAVKIAKAVKTGLGCDGVNVVQSNGPAAGQDVFHFHLHIKPRWHNDKVTLSWDTNKVQQNLLEGTRTFPTACLFAVFSICSKNRNRVFAGFNLSCCPYLYCFIRTARGKALAIR